MTTPVFSVLGSFGVALLSSVVELTPSVTDRKVDVEFTTGGFVLLVAICGIESINKLRTSSCVASSRGVCPSCKKVV